MKRQLGIISALIVGTVVGSQASKPGSKGMGLFEIDMNYDPAEYFPEKQERFDQPDSFSREINNFVASQGYKNDGHPPAYNGGKPAYGAEKPAYGGDKPAYGGDKPAYGGDKPAYGGDKPAYGGDKPAYGAEKPAYGAEKPAYGGAPAPTQGNGYHGASDAHGLQALNGPFAAMIPETIPFPQLLYKIQSMMQLNQNAYTGYAAPTSTCEPVCSTPTVTICCCPPASSSCSKHSTHTVYVSIESHKATSSDPCCHDPCCHDPCCHDPCCTTECCHDSDSDCDSDDECEKKHKHKHHKHKHHKHDDCSTTDECKPTECSTSEECEPTHKHKHKHKHKHHRHKHHKGKTGPEVEELDDNQCFGRAVLSLSSDGGEDVATIGKKLCQKEPQTALAAVETGHPCKCHCGGTHKNCCCGDHCTCDGYHTVLISVHSDCAAQPTHTAYESIECNPASDTRPKHTVLEAVEKGCVSSEKPTHTALLYVESHRADECPRNTHVVFESVACGCKPSSSVNTHTIYASIECNTVSNTAHTHTAYESIETGCAPKCPQNTHTVYQSVESSCECKPECPQNTHTVYQSVESSCECKPECKPECSQNTHTAYQSVESNCNNGKHTHVVYETVDSDDEWDHPEPTSETCSNAMHLANLNAESDLDIDFDSDEESAEFTS
ncbi:hypothetical protein LPJ78_005447 [Coemansia sp. RSA 989]|nr:hypothetical protein LPJ68_004185 [Coemansia sp. RSA 1086]KAJ1861250.1 hypothetical protein LPJ78_005447 [Coemansia sp. RSA 989]